MWDSVGQRRLVRVLAKRTAKEARRQVREARRQLRLNKLHRILLKHDQSLALLNAIRPQPLDPDAAQKLVGALFNGGADYSINLGTQGEHDAS